VTTSQAPASLHPLVPGSSIPGDWFAGRIPGNIETGQGTLIDSAACFQGWEATGTCGLRVGKGTTIWRATFAVKRNGIVEIGDRCHVTEAVLACNERITLGDDVLVAAGVAIVDSDFHPLGYGERIVDAEALSPLGKPGLRPDFPSRPVVVGNGVRIGYNATILKGVTIGEGAIIGPGAVVVKDVQPGDYVLGNPAQVVAPSERP